MGAACLNSKLPSIPKLIETRMLVCKNNNSGLDLVQDTFVRQSFNRQNRLGGPAATITDT